MEHNKAQDVQEAANYAAENWEKFILEDLSIQDVISQSFLAGRSRQLPSVEECVAYFVNVITKVNIPVGEIDEAVKNHLKQLIHYSQGKTK